MYVLHVYVLLHLATQVASLAASVQQVLHLLGWLATEGLHARTCVWLWALQCCYNGVKIVLCAGLANWVSVLHCLWRTQGKCSKFMCHTCRALSYDM